jgi:hypothetical protein
MSICEASGVEVWVGGVGEDNISGSDEVLKSRLDEDPIRESSNPALWLSVCSSAIVLLARRARTGSACLSATMDGGMRWGHDRNKRLDALNVAGRINIVVRRESKAKTGDRRQTAANRRFRSRLHFSNFMPIFESGLRRQNVSLLRTLRDVPLTGEPLY